MFHSDSIVNKYLCERQKSFIIFSTLTFKFEVININFWQIWHFDVKDTGQMGLQISVILTQTVGRFNT